MESQGIHSTHQHKTNICICMYAMLKMKNTQRAAFFFQLEFSIKWLLLIQQPETYPTHLITGEGWKRKPKAVIKPWTSCVVWHVEVMEVLGTCRASVPGCCRSFTVLPPAVFCPRPSCQVRFPPVRRLNWCLKSSGRALYSTAGRQKLKLDAAGVNKTVWQSQK